MYFDIHNLIYSVSVWQKRPFIYYMTLLGMLISSTILIVTFSCDVPRNTNGNTKTNLRKTRV